ncbi:hypothetical protein ACFQVA_13145 [Actinomadura keratinilytica]
MTEHPTSHEGRSRELPPDRPRRTARARLRTPDPAEEPESPEQSGPPERGRAKDASVPPPPGTAPP